MSIKSIVTNASCAALLALAPFAATTAWAQDIRPVVGKKLADGQAYVTLVRLSHQANPANNGRLLISFEENGMAGIPLYESLDEGTSWQQLAHATDPASKDLSKCNLHWQPHLTELPRDVGDLKAGTILLSASSVCTENRRTVKKDLQLYTSTDLGRTWKFRSSVIVGGDLDPVWEPNLQILDDGTFVSFYSSEQHKTDGYNQLLAHKLSTDGGKSWGKEIYDVAMIGGVERPGMVIVDRLPDKRYVYTFEDVAGPNPGQVYMKISADGKNWGSPADRGTPIVTQSGAWPAGCPTVIWLPVGGPKGVILVAARGAGGGGDSVGRSFYWNANAGVGPWWEVPAPVQKAGNSRAGWTQAMMLKKDGSLLHMTSSASADAPTNTSRNEILYAAQKLNFNRYEAEDAERKGSVQMRDLAQSNGQKVRLAANNIGRLTFNVALPKTGSYTLTVNYADIGLAATPRVYANGAAIEGSTGAGGKVDDTVRNRDLGTRGTGEKIVLRSTVDLKEGENVIDVMGGANALDVDFIEITPN